MKIIEVDENTKIPVKIAAVCGATLVTISSWLVSVSITATGADAKAKQANDAVFAIQVDRALHHDRYEQSLIEINSRLARIETKLDSIEK